MNSLNKFVLTTLTGGILFLLPAALVIILFNKAYQILLKISTPLQDRMPEIILGLDGSNLVALLLLVIICFFSGLIFRSAWVRNNIHRLEDGLLSYVPGYTLIKSIVSDAIGENQETSMTTVLVRDGDMWNIGFLVEQVGDLCTVFIPEAPRYDSGEVKIVPSELVKRTGITTNRASRSLKQYGKGASSWIGDK